MTNSLSWVWFFFVSSGTCYRWITLQLQASAFRFPGMCTVEAVWSCMLFKCCVFIVFHLCCSFLPTNVEFLSHSSSDPFGRVEKFSYHSLKMLCDKWSLAIKLVHLWRRLFLKRGKKWREKLWRQYIVKNPDTSWIVWIFKWEFRLRFVDIPAVELTDAYKHYIKQLITGIRKWIRKFKTWKHYWQKHPADPCLACNYILGM